MNKDFYYSELKRLTKLFYKGFFKGARNGGHWSIFDEDGNDVEKEFSFAQLALNTTIEMKNLVVTRIYTTNNGGDSDGAMTLTCTATGKDGRTYTIEVRTGVLYDADGNKVTQSYFAGKTIDVKGLVDSYSGSYQIALLSLNDVVVK
mgnify:CR=1 FL=1